MSHGDRRCRSCRFFQAAPLAGKGWCRNPVLYAPSQQHLVDGRELDCQRAFGDFWQAPLDLQEPAVDSLAPPAFGPVPDAAGAMAPALDDAPALSATPRRRGLGRPALAVALVVLLSALGTMVFLSGSPGAPVVRTLGPETTPIISAAPPLALVEPTAVPTSPPTATVAPVSLTVAPERSEPAPAPAEAAPAIVEPTATAVPEPVAAAPPDPAPAAPAARPRQPTPLPLPSGKLKVGGQGIVATGAADQRLRVRSAPDLQAGIIGRLANGAKLAIIDGPRQADGSTWWRVRAGTSTGWVAGEFVQPAVP
jgi:hypothetical protein